MRLISWNVNGLRACMQKGFMDFFNTIDADIFCIQESKMQREQSDFSFPNYQEFQLLNILNHHDCLKNKFIKKEEN